MSLKQVSHWEKIGLLLPTWRTSDTRGGRPALFYSAKAVIKALIICEMKRRGFKPMEVLEASRNLEHQGIRLDDAARYLLTDGYSVYYAESATRVVDILKHNNQMLLIPIHEHVRRLRKVA